MSEKSISSKNSFSKRQLEILTLLAQGKSNKEIAIELQIAYGTVKQHLFTIFRMLGLSNRGKVALVAKRILDSQESEKKLRSNALVKKNYSWRLISALVVTSAQTELKEPADIVKRNQFLAQMREFVMRQVIALEGKHMALPDGGVLAWFGHPIAHLDDSDRATQLAYLVQNWLLRDAAEAPFRLGVGLATHAEVVPSGLSDLYAADAYRIALVLAEQSLEVRLPLANGLIYRLSTNNASWLVLKPQTPLKQLINTDPDHPVSNHIAIRPLQPMRNYAQGKWGSLPFLKEVAESAQRGIAQWLAVESWPPSLALSLINAMGYEAQAGGFQVLHWRMPISKNSDTVISSLLTQLEANYPQLDLSAIGYAVSGGERLAAALASLAVAGPVLVQVYGIQALQHLKKILGDKGIDRLVSLPLMLIAADTRDLSQLQKESNDNLTQATQIKLLGPRPNHPLLSRIFTMKAPDMEVLPEGIRLDLQALLDELSDTAQQLIAHAANHPKDPMEELISQMKVPRPIIQGALRELITLGLIRPSQAHGFEFRDAWMAHAIKKMSSTPEWVA